MKKYFDSVINANTGRAVAGATVSFLDSVGNPVVTYADDAFAGAAITTTTDENGLFQRYVPNGVYTVRQTYGNVTVEVPGVEIFDDEQQEFAITRALLVPEGETGVILPEIGARAGKYLVFDANGAPAISDGSGADAALRTDLAVTGGASLVGSTHSGTGAELRSVQDKLRDVISVKDFGAEGDGVTDDTIAIQDALTAATAIGLCKAQAGENYRLTAAISIPSGVDLDLNGASLTLDYNATASAVVVSGGIRNGNIVIPSGKTQERIIATGTHSVKIEDIFIWSSDQQNNRSDNNDAAVKIDHDKCVCARVAVENFDNPFQITSADNVIIRDTRCKSYVRGYYVTDCDYLTLAGARLDTRSANGTTSPGHNCLLVTQTRWSSFSDFVGIDPGEHGVRIGGSTTHGCTGLTFSDFYIEKPGQCGFKIYDTSSNRTTNITINGLQVVDCSFGGASGTNEDGLRLESADNVMVTGFQVFSKDAGTSSYDGIFISNCTNITVVSPRIDDTKNHGIEINENNTTEIGVVNNIRITSPQITNCQGDGIRIDSPTQILRDVYITDAQIRAYSGYGVYLGAGGTITQPVVITGFVNSEGSGILFSNSTDSQLTIDLRPADQSFALNELTIASGAITLPTRARTLFIYVDTEGDASTDDLDTINGGGYGDILTVSAINDARTVVLKDNTGNLRLTGDISLDNSQDKVMLIYGGGQWHEIAKADNAA